MTPLHIPQGNDVYVKMDVVMQIKGAAMTESTLPVLLSDVNNLKVELINSIGESETIQDVAISDNVPNRLYMLLPSTLKCELYGVKVTGKYNNLDVSSYYPEIVHIVLTDEEADSYKGSYKGFDYYEFNSPFVTQFSGIIFPYLRYDAQDGHLKLSNAPDGGNFSIQNGHLIATDYGGY